MSLCSLNINNKIKSNQNYCINLLNDLLKNHKNTVSISNLILIFKNLDKYFEDSNTYSPLFPSNCIYHIDTFTSINQKYKYQYQLDLSDDININSEISINYLLASIKLINNNIYKYDFNTVSSINEIIKLNTNNSNKNFKLKLKINRLIINEGYINNLNEINFNKSTNILNSILFKYNKTITIIEFFNIIKDLDLKYDNIPLLLPNNNKFILKQYNSINKKYSYIFSINFNDFNNSNNHLKITHLLYLIRIFNNFIHTIKFSNTDKNGNLFIIKKINPLITFYITKCNLISNFNKDKLIQFNKINFIQYKNHINHFINNNKNTASISNLINVIKNFNSLYEINIFKLNNDQKYIIDTKFSNDKLYKYDYELYLDSKINNNSKISINNILKMIELFNQNIHTELFSLNGILTKTIRSKNKDNIITSSVEIIIKKTIIY